MHPPGPTIDFVAVDDPSADPGPPAPLRRVLRVPGPWDLRATLGPLRRGRGDPCTRISGRTLWRATRTPAGPASQAVVSDSAAATLTSWAWGPGAGWLTEALPDLVGRHDPADDFAALVSAPRGPARPPGWDVVAGLARRHPGLRIPATRAVVEALVPTVLEQKVTGIEAWRAWRDLATAFATPAPGPAGLVLPPDPARLAATPAWALHRFGIEARRADTIRRVAAARRRLEEAATMPPADATRRLCAVAGVGPWSAAEVGLVALGDGDAVSVGDFHLPNQVAWSLTGRPRGDDALMLELLEPWRGHRGRVLRLLAAGGVTAPKFGPRQPLRSFRSS